MLSSKGGCAMGCMHCMSCMGWAKEQALHCSDVAWQCWYCKTEEASPGGSEGEGEAASRYQERAANSTSLRSAEHMRLILSRIMKREALGPTEGAA